MTDDYDRTGTPHGEFLLAVARAKESDSPVAELWHAEGQYQLRTLDGVTIVRGRSRRAVERALVAVTWSRV